MIVSSRPEGLALVRQVDHQEQCRRMAERWGGPGFERIADWAALTEAAGRHDEGWREVDARPRVEPDGRPLDFPRIDRAEHCALFRRGIDLAGHAGPRAELLVSMHGAGLHQRRMGLDGPLPVDHAPAVERFLAEEEGRQADLRARLGDDLALAAWAWDAYLLLQAWDALSLYLVWRGLPEGRAGTLPSVPCGPGGPHAAVRLEPLGRLTARCDPFPFPGDEVSLPIPARIVEDRPYRDDEDLAAALAAARAVTLECVVVRPSGARR